MTIKQEMKALGKQIKGAEKGIEKDIKNVEGWVIERRKFLIKLTWVVGIIAALLILSNIYLKVRGLGI